MTGLPKLPPLHDLTKAKPCVYAMRGFRRGLTDDLMQRFIALAGPEVVARTHARANFAHGRDLYGGYWDEPSGCIFWGHAPGAFGDGCTHCWLIAGLTREQAEDLLDWHASGHGRQIKDVDDLVARVDELFGVAMTNAQLSIG